MVGHMQREDTARYRGTTNESSGHVTANHLPNADKIFKYLVQLVFFLQN